MKVVHDKMTRPLTGALETAIPLIKRAISARKSNRDHFLLLYTNAFEQNAETAVYQSFKPAQKITFPFLAGSISSATELIYC
jgi:hypothetical protein